MDGQQRKLEKVLERAVELGLITRERAEQIDARCDHWTERVTNGEMTLDQAIAAAVTDATQEGSQLREEAEARKKEAFEAAMAALPDLGTKEGILEFCEGMRQSMREQFEEEGRFSVMESGYGGLVFATHDMIPGATFEDYRTGEPLEPRSTAHGLLARIRAADVAGGAANSLLLDERARVRAPDEGVRDLDHE